ncbi:MAG: hypothetical protein ACI9G5_002994, partial [Paracoccaceae bacterium]
TPAPENPPPFNAGDVWEGVPTTASIPKSRQEMSRFIRVVLGLPNGMMYWAIGDHVESQAVIRLGRNTR